MNTFLLSVTLAFVCGCSNVESVTVKGALPGTASVKFKFREPRGYSKNDIRGYSKNDISGYSKDK